MTNGKPRVLIVENDTAIAANLYEFLELKGFLPDAAYEGHAALGLLASQSFDAMILDIGLPGLDGYGVLQAVRQSQQATMPVLMLTARDQLSDKLTAFSLGADDYLVKPFALAEVEARLRVMLRHLAPAPREVLAFAGIVYDTSTQTVTVFGKRVPLMRKSLLILGLLLQNPEVVITQDVLASSLWPGDPPSAQALRSQMHLLRKKMLEAGFGGIETVHGLGWRLTAK